NESATHGAVLVKFGLLGHPVGDLDRHRTIKEVPGRPQETELINRVLEVNLLVIVRLKLAAHLPVDQPLMPGRLVYAHPVNVTLEAPPPTQRDLEAILNHRLTTPVLQGPPLPHPDMLQGAAGYIGGLRRTLIDGIPNGLDKLFIDEIL